VREEKKRSKNMQERVRRPIAVFVVSVLLLGALAAGAALTVNINGTVGDEMAGGPRAVGSLEESLGSIDLMAGNGRITDGFHSGSRITDGF
jgi:hypothetical protein